MQYEKERDREWVWVCVFATMWMNLRLLEIEINLCFTQWHSTGNSYAQWVWVGNTKNKHKQNPHTIYHYPKAFKLPAFPFLFAESSMDVNLIFRLKDSQQQGSMKWERVCMCKGCLGGISEKQYLHNWLHTSKQTVRVGVFVCVCARLLLNWTLNESLRAARDTLGPQMDYIVYC